MKSHRRGKKLWVCVHVHVCVCVCVCVCVRVWHGENVGWLPGRSLFWWDVTAAQAGVGVTVRHEVHVWESRFGSKT